MCGRAILRSYWKAAGVLGWVTKSIRDLVVPSRPLAPLEGHTLYMFEVSYFAFLVRRKLWTLGYSLPMKDILWDGKAYRDLVSQGGKDQVPCLKIEMPGSPVRWMYESEEINRYLGERLHKN